MVHTGYIVEAIILQVVALVTFLALTSTLLSFRFLPRFRINSAHFTIARIAFVAICLHIVRCVDPSNVFNVLSVPVTHLFQSHVVVCVIYVVAVRMDSSISVVNAALHKAVSRWRRAVIYFFALSYHAVITITSIMEFTYSDNATLYRLMAIRAIAFMIVACAVLLISGFVSLRSRASVAIVVRRLRDLEKREQQAAEQAKLAEGKPMFDTSPRTLSPIHTADNSVQIPINNTSGDDSDYYRAPLQLPRMAKQNQVVNISSLPSPISLRIRELEAGLRSLYICCVIVDLAAIAGIIGRFSTLITYGKGEIDMTEYQADPNVYTTAHALGTFGHIFGILFMLHQSWLSSSIWRNSRQRFLPTLLFGPYDPKLRSNLILSHGVPPQPTILTQAPTRVPISGGITPQILSPRKPSAGIADNGVHLIQMNSSLDCEIISPLQKPGGNSSGPLIIIAAPPTAPIVPFSPTANNRDLPTHREEVPSVLPPFNSVASSPHVEMMSRLSIYPALMVPEDPTSHRNMRLSLPSSLAVTPLHMATTPIKPTLEHVPMPLLQLPTVEACLAE